jgi:hypothetical protein
MNRRNFLQAAAALALPALPTQTAPKVTFAFGVAKQWVPGSVTVYGWAKGVGWMVLQPQPLSMRHEEPWLDRGEPRVCERYVQRLPSE